MQKKFIRRKFIFERNGNQLFLKPVSALREIDVKKNETSKPLKLNEVGTRARLFLTNFVFPILKICI